MSALASVMNFGKTAIRAVGKGINVHVPLDHSLVLRWGVSLVLFLSSLPCLGANGSRIGGVDGVNPTFFFDLTFGFSTYHSKLVNTNDRNTHYTYTFGGTAGLEYQYVFLLKTDANTTAFELNGSEISTQWRDSIFRYRTGWFYLGLVVSQVEMLVSSSGTDIVNGFGQGFGGNFGLQLPVGKSGILYLDLLSASISSTKDVLSETTTFGSRTDIDIGGAIDLTKRAIDFLVGYRLRTFTVTTDASYLESIWTTYVGFRFAAFF